MKLASGAMWVPLNQFPPPNREKRRARRTHCGYRLTQDVADAFMTFGFETLGLETIVGDTASGNRRVEKLARWFGAEILASREGPKWMTARGWREVDWALGREEWEEKRDARGRWA